MKMASVPCRNWILIRRFGETLEVQILIF